MAARPCPGQVRNPGIVRLNVEIDPGSGFCGGVIRAIGRAEEYLSGGGTLYSLGAIVHNEAELERLGAKGLVTVSSVSEAPSGEALLIRAHGEPPETYSSAAERNLSVIDCTCPVVLKLQQSIREAWERIRGRGELLIFGKPGHAEVLGLVGQTGGGALVVQDLPMLEGLIAQGCIPKEGPLEIFSQTTKSPSEYREICSRLRKFLSPKASFMVHDTICAQVARRHEKLREFAASHDAIVFVAGVSSSNGKVLYDLCKSVNERTHHIGGPSGIDYSWFSDGDSVGVCGATSTPSWLLEEVAAALASA